MALEFKEKQKEFVDIRQLTMHEQVRTLQTENSNLRWMNHLLQYQREHICIDCRSSIAFLRMEREIEDMRRQYEKNIENLHTTIKNLERERALERAVLNDCQEKLKSLQGAS